MIIGIPKEIKNNEKRVSLTPFGAEELISLGHIVYLQKNAGLGSGFSDNTYVEYGVKIIENIEDIESSFIKQDYNTNKFKNAQYNQKFLKRSKFKKKYKFAPKKLRKAI